VTVAMLVWLGARQAHAQPREQDAWTNNGDASQSAVPLQDGVGGDDAAVSVPDASAAGAASVALAPEPLLHRPQGEGAQAAGQPSTAPAAPVGGAWSPTLAQPMSITGAPGRGVTFTTAQEASGESLFSLTLRGRFQVRDTVVLPTQAFSLPRPESVITNELTIRTVRVLFSGHVFRRSLQYLLQLALGARDFEMGTVSPVFDAWVSTQQWRDLNVRVGQFFVPFDRARTTAEWGLTMIDRALIVSEATLDRDVGVELSSNDLAGLGRVAYRVAVMGGEGKNRLAATPGFLYVARVQLHPFGAFDDSVEGDLLRGRAPRLALAVATAFNHRATRTQSTQGATLQSTTVDYTHLAADVTLKWRGLYLCAEVLYRRADRDELSAPAMGTMGEYSRSLWGYTAHAGLMVSSTLELATRLEQSFAIGNTDPALLQQLRAQGNAVGLGLNWYVSGHGLKLQSDYQYIFGPVFDQGRSQLRLQLQVSL
jgi:hypothetical protein